MSTGSTTMPVNGSPGAAAARRRLPRLRDAQIRSKLALILVVPLAAVLALAGVRLIDVGSRAAEANQVEQLTRLSTDVSELTHFMQLERISGARYLASPANSPAARTAGSAYDTQVSQTDDRIERYATRVGQLAEPSSAVRDRLARIDEQLRAMDGIRRQVRDRDQFPMSTLVLRYGTVITELVGYGEVLAQIAGAGSVAKGLRAVSAYARAKAGAGDQQAVAFAARSSGNDLSTEDFSAFLATMTTQQEAMQSFYLSATQDQRSVVDNTVTGPAVAFAEQVNTDISRSLGGFAQVTAEQAADAYGAVGQLMREAEQRLEDDLVKEAAKAGDAVTRQASIEGILILITLLIALIVAFILARSLNQSLRKLREGALSVANRDLPEAVARLRDVRNLGDGGGDDILRQVRDPIRLSNRDEIGQVAQAFNIVHTEAVRIAVEQAALRTSVSAMFLNLARRSQSLVDRMIGELDHIERGEEDPKRLAQLFELDHLATRMRRNDENLLVLAGADSSPPRREDALLVDALRAAQSEIELYNRVEFGTVDTDISIAATAVNDVVRLIAELLDNATRFSPPTTVVVADGRRVRDYVMVQVEDRGLGMSEEQMNNLNRRLAQPPGVDVAAFRLMGLAVVGRLASRYGIRVELRANLEGGTVAQVILPSSIVVLPNRSIEPPARPARAPQQLESGPSVSGWASSGRTGTATATLPAVSPDPWQPQRTDPNEDERLISANTTTMPTVNDIPRQPVEATPARPATPRVPTGPSLTSRPLAANVANGSVAHSGADVFQPPGRSARSAAPGSPVPGAALPGSAMPGPAAPVLPAAQAQPAAPASPARPASVLPAAPVLPAGPNGPAAGSATPVPQERQESTQQPARPPLPMRGARPTAPGTEAPAAFSTAAMGSPTVAYPTVKSAPTVGFVTPDGTSIPAPPRPTSPNPSGWGAALAAMPPPPPPPAPAPPEDRGEAPIFREMQASWFKEYSGSEPGEWSMPTAGYAPPPRPAPNSDTPAGPATAGNGTGPMASAPAAAPTTGLAAASATGPAAGPVSPSAGDSSGARETAPSAGLLGALPGGSARPTSGGPAQPSFADSDRPMSGAPAHLRPGGAANPLLAPADAGSAHAPAGPAAPVPDDGVPAGTGPAGNGAADNGTGPNGTDRNGATEKGAGHGTDTHTGGRRPLPRQRAAVEDAWRTAADEGWHRAMAAAEPPDAGTTRSGLPKRVPQAQLVPGGVQSGPRDQTRRTPDEVRGLLSAYHRGVQRGRTAGSAEATAAAPVLKENEQ